MTFVAVSERFCIAASTSSSYLHESEESVRESYNPCVIVTESPEDLPSEELTAPPSEEDPLPALFSDREPLKTSEGVLKRCAMLNSSSSLLRSNLIFVPREGGIRTLSSSDYSSLSNGGGVPSVAGGERGRPEPGGFMLVAAGGIEGSDNMWVRSESRDSSVSLAPSGSAMPSEFLDSHGGASGREACGDREKSQD